MNRFVRCGLGLVVAVSACSAMAAPALGQTPSSTAVKAPTISAPLLSKTVNGPMKAFQQVKPCPYRRS